MALRACKGGAEIEQEDVENILREFADRLKWFMTNKECQEVATKLMHLFENGPELKKFRVMIPELHFRQVTVEARNKDEAMGLAIEVDEERTEYEKTFEHDEIRWMVEEVRE